MTDRALSSWDRRQLVTLRGIVRFVDRQIGYMLEDRRTHDERRLRILFIGNSLSDVMRIVRNTSRRWEKEA